MTHTSPSQGSFLLFGFSAGFALVLSFLCSLMEASLLSLTPGQLADIARKRPRRGDILRQFKQNMERPITVILLLNTIANTMGATLAGAQFAMLFGNRAVGFFSAAFTYVLLQFCEILPKSLGVRFSPRISLWMARPLVILTRVFAPVIDLTRLVTRPFEGRHKPRASTHLDELIALASHARVVQAISARQESIIARTARLSHLTAKDVMIPADQITFLSTDQTLGEAIVAAHLDPHTRFPVINGGDRDQVLGYVNFKELAYRARTNPADPTLKGIIRPLRFVRGETPCLQIMKAFIDEHEHMAIVQDGAGHTQGLITLEDLVEELLGDIEDEFDRLPRMCHALSKGVWIVGGGVPMAELAAKLNLPDLSGAGTVSDWVISRLGHMPAVDERLHVGGLEWHVRRIRRGKVFEVLISPKPAPPATGHGKTVSPAAAQTLSHLPPRSD